MNKNKNGFTLIEILIVIVVLSILMAIAVPSIMGVSNKMKTRSLESKIEAIEEAAVIYAQDNSNKIKSQILTKNNATTCKSDQTGRDGKKWCQCDPNSKTSNDCKFVFTMTVDELIHLGAYETEKEDELDSVCDIPDPRNNGMCLDCVPIEVQLDDDYKSATAKLEIDDIKDGKTVCN